jgi:hypothetical protein
MWSETPATVARAGVPTTSGIMVVVRHGAQREALPVEEWLRRGPDLDPSAEPVAAWLAPSGYPLPLSCVVPLRYRNSRLSRMLIALRLVADPWRR